MSTTAYEVYVDIESRITVCAENKTDARKKARDVALFGEEEVSGPVFIEHDYAETGESRKDPLRTCIKRDLTSE